LGSSWVLPEPQYTVTYSLQSPDLQKGPDMFTAPAKPSLNDHTKLPKAFTEIWLQFGQFYCTDQERRCLEFRLDEGICEVTFISDVAQPHIAKTLVVTPIMAVALLHLAKQSKFILWKDLVEQLSIEPQLLAEHMMPLCQPTTDPKKCIVRKSTPETNGFKPDDKLLLSKQFESNSAKHYIKFQKKQTEKDKSNQSKELLKLRLMSVKAVIVRYLKMTKQCKHNDLHAEIHKQLGQRFSPPAAMIKEAIDALANDELLERDSDDHTIYHYKA
jgi:hypothetical protein